MNVCSVTCLEWSTHKLPHQPEDLAADLEYLVHRARPVSCDAEAKVEFDSLKEARRFVALRVGDCTQR